MSTRFWCNQIATGASHDTTKGYDSSSLTLSLRLLLRLAPPLVAGTFVAALLPCPAVASALIRSAERPLPPIPTTIPVIQATAQKT